MTIEALKKKKFTNGYIRYCYVRAAQVLAFVVRYPTVRGDMEQCYVISDGQPVRVGKLVGEFAEATRGTQRLEVAWCMPTTASRRERTRSLDIEPNQPSIQAQDYSGIQADGYCVCGAALTDLGNCPEDRGYEIDALHASEQ